MTDAPLKILLMSADGEDEAAPLKTRFFVGYSGWAAGQLDAEIEAGKHDFKVWRSDLYHFAQLIFREPDNGK